MAAPGFGKDMFSNLKTELPGQLPAYLKGQRWFGAKARELRATEVVDFVPLERDGVHALIVMVKVEYEGGGGGFVFFAAGGDEGLRSRQESPGFKPQRRTRGTRKGSGGA